MTAPAAHFYKEKTIKGDRISYEYHLVLDGEVVGVVKTLKQATKWWERTMADLKRMEIAITREVKARRYALHL